MWKTLGCLVVAMTGTSAMLNWMDPSCDSTPRIVTQSEIASLVRESVESGFSADIDPSLWREIEVVPSARRTLSNSLLAARRIPLDYHFYVDRSGRPLKTVRWRRQQVTAGRPGLIRIEVAASAPGEAISVAQRFCVEQLCDTLSRFLHVNRQSLAVRWPVEWVPNVPSHASAVTVQ